MKFRWYVKRGEKLVIDNSTVLLTTVGVVGVVTTAVLTAKATARAVRILDRYEEIDPDPVLLTWRDKVKIVWVPYIPPVGVGAVTIVCIVMSNRLDSKKAAALATVYGLSEKAFTEYKEKVIEKLGETKEQSIRDEIAQDRVNATPVKEVIIVGNGEVLCFDALTGRYFQSSVERIKKAANKINYDITHHSYASLSQFYQEIGLSPTSYSEDIGWNLDHLCELTFSTTMSSDDRPCIVVDFLVGPTQYYDKLY